MGQDVIIGAPIAGARASAPLPGASPEEWLRMENQVMRVSLTEQEISAETFARMCACLVRFIQYREGLPFDAVVELPRNLLIEMGDVKISLVERAGSFQISLRERR